MRTTLYNYAREIAQGQGVRYRDNQPYWHNDYTATAAKKAVIREIIDNGFYGDGFDGDEWDGIYIPKSYKGRKAVAEELIDMHTYMECCVDSSDDVEDVMPSQRERYNRAWGLYQEYNGLDMYIELAVEQLTQHFSGNSISVDS